MTDLPEELDEERVEEESPELFEHFRFTADRGQTVMRIDKYLVNCMPRVSRNRIQEAADAGQILVNDQPVKSNYRVKPADIISIVLSFPPTEIVITPQDIPLNIVYEDADLLLINKQPALVVHPGVGNLDGTLLNALAFHLQDESDFDINNSRVGLVHRIDKDTSGLLLIAKTEEAKTRLGKQFFDKTTERLYHALVWGTVQADTGTITGNIGRSLKDRMQMAVFPEGDYGKHAVTHYRVVERLGYVTLVECRLETGRTHQIRVHMKHIGHTLFNDARYGGDEILKGTTFAKYKQFVHNCFAICPRQALHAKTLGFTHPRTNDRMSFDSELPLDMVQLIEKWRGYINNRNEE